MRVEKKLSGNLDQESAFFDDPLPTDPSCELYLHMKDVGFINSTGIMRWMRWCKTVPSTMKVVLTECPINFVVQGDLINRFFPENFRIESVRTFFFCERDSEETPVLLKRGTEYIYAEDSKTNAPEVHLPKVNCPLCAQMMVPDFNESKVFAFLKKTT